MTKHRLISIAVYAVLAVAIVFECLTLEMMPQDSAAPMLMDNAVYKGF